MDLGNIEGVTLVRSDEQLPSRPLLIVLYGDPGLGKTTLSFTAPKPFEYDFDKGAHRADQTHRPFVIAPDKYDGVRKIVDGPLAGQVQEHGYQTAILDTVGTMLDNYVAPWLINQNAKFGNNSGGLAMSGWGALAIEYNNFIRKHREMGLHVVAICHAKYDDDREELVLDVKGGSKTILYQTADVMGYIEKDPQGRRYVDFEPVTGKRIGKNPAGLKPQLIPDVGDPKHETFLADLITTIQDHMSKMTAAQKEALDKVEQYRTMVNSCTDLDELEQLEAVANELSPSYRAIILKLINQEYAGFYAEANFADLKTPKDYTKMVATIPKEIKFRERQGLVWERLVAQAADNGLEFDKQAKKFVEVVEDDSEQASEEQE